MFKLSVQFLIAGLLTLPGLAAAAGPVKLPATSQAACFDENGDLRACGGTGEDGEKQAGVAWPTVRFSDNNDGTVTDNLTGLIWSQHANAPMPDVQSCPNVETSMTWLQALDFVACLNANGHAGFIDWRLPNLNELESMVNPGVADTTAYLNANGFGLPGQPSSRVQPGRYWSSTSDASGLLASQSAIAAWDVDLLRGGVPVSTLKNDLEFLPRAVWPVRGTTSTPAQLWKTGQSLCFDEVGDPITCTGTGADGEKQAGAIWPTPRFKPNSSATFAVDRLTKLIWTTATQTPGPDACADTGYALTWQEALDHVACLNAKSYLGRSDWRLPNRKELRSLADYSTGAPALPAGHPFDDLEGETYWTSTTNLASPTDAWAISIFDGSLSSARKAEGYLPAWPVCGPEDVAPILTINQGDMATKVATQTITGTVSGAEATVTVAINGGAPAAAAVTGTNWSYSINPLAAGVNAITVTAGDFSGNQSTALISITFDAVGPALTINQSNMTTKGATQTITGTVEAGATVTVSVNNGTPVAATVSGTNWSCPIGPLAAGANTVTLKAADAYDNTTMASISITLDTAAPALALNKVADKTNKKYHPIGGVVEPGTTVSVKMGSATLPVTINGANWSCNLIDLAAGANNITVTATDAAGNVATQTATINFRAPDGIVSGGSAVKIDDALKTLRIAVGIIPPADDDLLRGDVAPPGAPDDKIDVSDVVLILKKVVGLQSF